MAGAVVVGLLGCETGVPPGATKVTREYTVTAPVSSVVINGGGGKVTVTGQQRSTVRVTELLHYSKTRPATKHGVSGSTLTLSYTCAAQLNCGVAYTVLVPRGVAVKVVNRQGAITLDSLAGPVTARTLAGTITATGLSSRSADLQATAGSIKADFSVAPDSVKATTHAGTVTLNVPGSVVYQVDAHTFVGVTSVSVRRAPSSGHKISVSTSLGSIKIAPTP